MKKLVISSYDDINNPYYGGGGARAIHEIAKRLSKEYEVTVLTGKYPSSRNLHFEGVSYERIGLHFFGPKFGQLIFTFLLPIMAYVKQYDLWIDSLTPPFSASLLPLFSKKPVIGLVHMLAGEDMERKYKLPFKFFEKIGIKFYKNIIVTSNTLRKKILSYNKTAKVVIIPNGVSTKAIRELQKREYMLFLGRLEVDQKGLDLLIQAYSQIRNNTKLKLVIVGGGEKKQIAELYRLISKEKLGNRIQLLGKLDGLKKEELIARADCIVLPSRFETYSMVSLEALAYGIPLVTFDIEGLRWIPKKMRFIAPQMTANSLSKAILDSTHKSETYKIKIKKGVIFSRNFNWDNSAKKYNQFLSNI